MISGFFFDDTTRAVYLFLKFQFARCRIRQNHLRLFPFERDTLLRRVFVLSFNSLIVFGRAPYFFGSHDSTVALNVFCNCAHLSNYALISYKLKA